MSRWFNTGFDDNSHSALADGCDGEPLDAHTHVGARECGDDCEELGAVLGC